MGGGLSGLPWTSVFFSAVELPAEHGCRMLHEVWFGLFVEDCLSLLSFISPLRL